MKDDNYLDIDFTDISSPNLDRRNFIRLTGGGIFIFMILGHFPSLWAQREGRFNPH